MLGLFNTALALSVAALATITEGSGITGKMRPVTKFCGGRLGAAMRPAACKAPVGFKPPMVCMSAFSNNAVRPSTERESKGFFRRPAGAWLLPIVPGGQRLW